MEFFNWIFEYDRLNIYIQSIVPRLSEQRREAPISTVGSSLKPSNSWIAHAWKFSLGRRAGIGTRTGNYARRGFQAYENAPIWSFCHQNWHYPLSSLALLGFEFVQRHLLSLSFLPFLSLSTKSSNFWSHSIVVGHCFEWSPHVFSWNFEVVASDLIQKSGFTYIQKNECGVVIELKPTE